MKVYLTTVTVGVETYVSIKDLMGYLEKSAENESDINHFYCYNYHQD